MSQFKPREKYLLSDFWRVIAELGKSSNRNFGDFSIKRPSLMLDRITFEDFPLAEIVSCPHCELKLSLKATLKGQRLACPKCKGQFTVPNGEGEAGKVSSQSSDSKSAPLHGGAVDFLSDITSASPGPSAQSTSTKPGMGPRTPISKSRTGKKQDSMMPVYIIGGIGAFLVLFVVGMIALNSSPAKPPEDLRFGLTENTRRAVFKQLIKSVDNYGMSKACVNEWRETGARYKLGDKEIEAILSEGFNASPTSWDPPEFDHASANSRAHRMEWIKSRTELKREPQLQ